MKVSLTFLIIFVAGLFVCWVWKSKPYGISELRTSRVARYTENFTPPTEPYPRIGVAKLIIDDDSDYLTIPDGSEFKWTDIKAKKTVIEGE